MNFIETIKQKAFKRYNVNAFYDEENKTYNIANSYHEYINEDFFSHLKSDLALPKNEKSLRFSFHRNELKGFKNSCLQSVIKENPSLEEFDNYFHSFYKNIPLNDLFRAIYIKSDFNGKAVKNSVYQPYITYFLKQDFNHQNLYPDNFIKALHFNFDINKDNYPDLKESLYCFLSQHSSNLKDKIKNGYYNNIDEKIKEFETSMYEAIARFIKLEDLKMFNSFWPHILIKSNNENMITEVKNTFVFDLNYSYLSDVHPQITNETIAKDTCHFIQNIINHELSEFLTSSIIVEEPSYTRFYIHFKKSLNKESIPDIFDKCIELKTKTNQFQDHYLKPQYKEIHEKLLFLLKKEVNYMDLNSQFPAKNIIVKKNKI